MERNVSRALKWLAVITWLGVLCWSVIVRVEWDPQPSDMHQAGGVRADGEAAALLLDLDDSASIDVRREVAGALRRAMAPAPWPRARGSMLGTVLSESAQLYRVAAPEHAVRDVLTALRELPGVEGVEVEGFWTLPETDLASNPLASGVSAERPRVDTHRQSSFVPNDPYYKYQWHLDQIQMPAAWLRTQGKGAVVAVIDTGVSFETRQKGQRTFAMAPDLVGARFVPGYDFVDGDAHPTDEHGHGTHVAGTIAQRTNNRLGVAGVAPEASIMPLRVLDGRGQGSFGNVAAAIRFATDHGAHVINLSLGGGLPSPAVRRAIHHAHAQGVTVVAAAGNASRARVEYPARHPHVLAVGAVRFDEALTFYSCFGKGLDLVAPGGDTRVDQNGDGVADGVLQNTLVPGTTDRHDYVPYMGTSMAAPHVAGVVALLWASGVRHPDTIEKILKHSAKEKGDAQHFGAGLLQADRSLAFAERGLGGLRGISALLFSGLLLFGLRRAGGIDGRMRSLRALALAAFLAGGASVLDVGSWVVRGLGPVLGDTARLVAAFAHALVGGVPALALCFEPWSALALRTALPPLGLTLLLLGVRGAVPWLFAVTVACFAWLLVEALVPTVTLAPVPGIVLGPWFLSQASVCAWLAFLIARARTQRKLS